MSITHRESGYTWFADEDGDIELRVDYSEEVYLDEETLELMLQEVRKVKQGNSENKYPDNGGW